MTFVRLAPDLGSNLKEELMFGYFPAAILAAMLFNSSVAMATTVPAFEDYPATVVDKKPRLKPKLERGSDFWEYRTKIREGAAEPINFAGRYIFVSWGCGTSCQYSVIIDGLTGEIHDGIIGTDFEFQTDSNLLIASPTDDDEEFDVGVFVRLYYVFDGSNLLRIYNTDPIPWDSELQ